MKIAFSKDIMIPDDYIDQGQYFLSIKILNRDQNFDEDIKFSWDIVDFKNDSMEL